MKISMTNNNSRNPRKNKSHISLFNQPFGHLWMVIAHCLSLSKVESGDGLDTRASLSNRNQDRHSPVSSTNQCDDWLDYSLHQTFHDSRALRTVWYWQWAWQILSDWHLFYRHFPIPPLTKTMSGCAIWHRSIWPNADSQPWTGRNLQAKNTNIQFKHLKNFYFFNSLRFSIQ